MAKDTPGGQADPKDVPSFIKVWSEHYDAKNEQTKRSKPDDNNSNNEGETWPTKIVYQSLKEGKVKKSWALYLFFWAINSNYVELCRTKISQKT